MGLKGSRSSDKRDVPFATGTAFAERRALPCVGVLVLPRPTSSVRRLLVVPRITARLVAAALALGVVAFFALTQTEVGRDGLRQRLERGFARQFAGTLRVEHLSGNLVGTLVADGVALVAPSGDTVLAAQRVVARPKWVLRLLRNTVELRSMEASGVRMHLVRDSSRRWNVQDVFQKRHPSTRPPSTREPVWRLGTPRLVLDSAEVRVEDRTPRPAVVARGQVFDALNARYDRLSARVSLRGDRRERWVDVEQINGRIPDRNFDVQRLSGTLRLTDSTRAGYGLRLDAGATHLRGNVLATTGEPLRLALSGNADFDVLRRLVPALPLASSARLNLVGAMRRDASTGTLRAAVTTLRLDRRGAALDASGTFWQDADSLRLNLDHLDASATPDGLSALVPRIPAALQARLAPELRLDLDATTVALPRGTPGALRISTRGTAVQGREHLDVQALLLDRRPDGTLRWDARLAAADLALTRWLPDRPETVLTGQVATHGEASPNGGAGVKTGRWTLRTADLSARLGPGLLAGRRLDSLRLDLAVRGPDVRSRGRLAPSGAGSASFDLAGRPATAPSLPHAVKGRLAFDRFDAGALALRGGFSTQITGMADVDVAGRTARDLVGQLALDVRTAEATRGRDRLVLHDVRLTTRRTASGSAGDFLNSLVGESSGTVGDLLAVWNGQTYTTGGVRLDARRDLSGTSLLDLALDRATLPGQGGAFDLHQMTASFRHEASGAVVLGAATPQGRVDLRGNADVAALRALADAYRPRLAAYLSSRLPARDSVSALPMLPPLLLPTRGIALTGTAVLTDTSLVPRFVPGLHASGLRFAFDASTADSALDVRLAFAADTLAHSRIQAGRVQGRIGLRDDGTVHLTVDAFAGHLASGAIRADDATAAARLSGDHVALRVLGLRRLDGSDTDPANRHREQRTSDALAEGELDLDALDAGALAHSRATAPPIPTLPPDTLRLVLNGQRLTDRVRVALDTFSVGTGERRLVARPTTFDAYRDALVLLQPVELTGAVVPQVLRLSGVLSRQPSDTLQVVAERIALGTVVATTPLRQRLSGAVNARLAVASALARPDVSGTLHIDSLQLQGLVAGEPSGKPVPLGDLDVKASYAPGDSLGWFSVALGRGTNRALGNGTFRLPTSSDAGAIDATLDLEHLNASLLDALVPALFRSTTGSAHGLFTLQGSLRQPDYAADLVLDSVHTTMPLLGTAGRANGFVRITPQGIVLRSVRATDPTGGSVIVDGSLDGPIGRPPTVNLALTMNEFRLINLPAATEFPIYGQVWLSGTGTVQGKPNALRITARNAVAAPRSNVFIPLRAQTTTAVAPGYLTFLDTLGLGPEAQGKGFRPALGLDLDLNVRAPSGTGFNLAFDPLVGDVMRAKGSGRLQLRLHEGVFQMFGGVDIEGGDYLFTAGDVFVRRFTLDGGALVFDGQPTDARINVQATYRTRASLAGLPIATDASRLVPLVVRMDVTERLSAPRVALTLALDRSRDARASAAVEGFETLINQPERQAEYATSVLLTNSFLLTSQAAEQAGLAQSGNQLAFASLSQLVASQLNRYLADVLPGVELTLGLQGTRTSALDVTYGVALRLMDDRLTVRGQGVLSTDAEQTASDALRGEFVVELRLSPVVSAEVFYRREDDLLESVASGTLTSTAGANLSYRTRFASWRQFWQRLLGREDP